MQLYSVKPSRWNMNMLGACSGDAYDFCYQVLKDRPQLTWPQLADLMRSRYKASLMERQALLESRQAGNQTVDQFVEKLQLEPAWETADSDFQVSTFIQGLKPELRAAIILHHPQSLHQAVELACTAETLARQFSDGPAGVAQLADGDGEQAYLPQVKELQPVIDNASTAARGVDKSPATQLQTMEKQIDDVLQRVNGLADKIADSPCTQDFHSKRNCHHLTDRPDPCRRPGRQLGNPRQCVLEGGRRRNVRCWICRCRGHLSYTCTNGGGTVWRSKKAPVKMKGDSAWSSSQGPNNDYIYGDFRDRGSPQEDIKPQTRSSLKH